MKINPCTFEFFGRAAVGSILLFMLGLPPVTYSASVTVQWEPPTTNTDGSALLNLAYYRLYYGFSSRNYTFHMETNKPAAYVDGLIANSNYYFAVVAVNSNSMESHYSNESMWNQLAALQILTSTNAVTVPEGSTASFQVKLNAAPVSPTTVTVSRLRGDTDVTVQSGTSLVFNASSWNTNQTVILSAAEDTDTVNSSAVIRCSVMGGANTEVTATVQKIINLALASRGSTIAGNNGGSWDKLIDGVTNGHTGRIGYGYTVWTCAGKMTLDLKSVCTISSTKLLLWDLDTRYYQYKIEASSNNTTWTTIVDRTATTNRCRSWQAIGFDSAIQARYLRLIGTYNSANSQFHAVEWEVYGTPLVSPLPAILTSTNAATTNQSSVTGTNTSVTATEQEIMNLALASRGSTITGNNGTNWDKLIDSVTNGYTGRIGYGCTDWTDAGTMTLDLKSVCTISSTKLLLWDLDTRYYQYKIEASSNNTTWTTIVDRTATTNRCRSWQAIGFDSAIQARYLRLIGTYNSANSQFHAVEWEVYGTPLVSPSPAILTSTNAATTNQSSVTGTNTSVTATEEDNDRVVNFALASRGSTITGNNGASWDKLIDGVTTGYTGSAGYGYTYYRGSSNAGAMTLDLKSLYPITRVKLLLWDLDSRYYRYKIEASSNNTTWTTIVNRTATTNQCRSWQDISFDSAIQARYLRLVGTYSSANTMFHVVEWEVYGTVEAGGETAMGGGAMTGARSSSGKSVAIPEPMDVRTSDPEPDTNGWKAVDGNLGTFWQGQADAGGWWLVLAYGKDVKAQDIQVQWGEGSATNLMLLGSVDAEQWYDLKSLLKLGSVSFEYLWLVFPAGENGIAPKISEIWVDPAE